MARTSLAETLLALEPGERRAELARMSERQRRSLKRHWRLWAHEGQIPPADGWHTWLVMAGRGFGKTRAGAEWARAIAEADGTARIALVAASLGEARRIMVEGDSGLLAIAPPKTRPDFEPSKRTLAWPNGARATLYSAGEPESLRGPQHSHVSKAKLAIRQRPRRKANAGWSRRARPAIGPGRTASSPAARSEIGYSPPRVMECGCWTDRAVRRSVTAEAGSAPSRPRNPPAARSPMRTRGWRSRN